MITKPLRETGAAFSVAQKPFASLRQTRSSRREEALTPNLESRKQKVEMDQKPSSPAFTWLRRGKPRLLPDFASLR
jgi:hypothetical protein